MEIKTFLYSLCLPVLFLYSCKKSQSPAPIASVSAGTVLNSVANVVIVPTYATLAKDASLLYNGAVILQSAPTGQNLIACRQLWLNASADYEQSSASLFGPNGSIGADPVSLINTYPIDTFGINSLVNSSAVFTLYYIDSLPSYLTGFHGMEFELYGINGNKTAAQFTAQQLSYISAVALNIKTLTRQVDSTWQNYYLSQFVTAGNGSAVYPDLRAAFADLTFGIANICETDGIYKLNGIFANHSTILQESPFANNSVNDIKNNLIGVQNIYLGLYGGVTGTGLTAFVKQNAVNLDLKIKDDINSAIASVNAITLPLSQAISSQKNQVQLAINACDSLDDDLKNSLLTYLNANTN